MISLIPNWQSSWRFTSVQAGLALGLIDACYAANFFGLQDAIGLQWFGLFNAVMTAGVIPMLRNVQQKSTPVSLDVKQALVAESEAVPVKVEGPK